MPEDNKKVSEVEEVYDYQDASNLWAEMHNQLASAEQALTAVDNRLTSFGLSVLDNLGMSARNRSDAEIRNTSIAAIKRLSKRDLIRKREYLLEDMSQLERNIATLNAKRSDFKQREYLQKQHVQVQFDAQEQRLQRGLYQHNPSLFFKTLLIDLPVKDPKVILSPNTAEQLFTAANQIALASPEFNFIENPEQVLQAWNIVDRAREEALQQLRVLGTQKNQDIVAAEKAHVKNVAMFNNAQQMFENLINALPSGMQGLLIIYSARDYDKVNQYLKEIAAALADPNKTPDWNSMAQKLAHDIQMITETNARNMLSSMVNFKNLDPAVQDELIKQKAYTMRLSYDLSFVADGDTKVQALEDLKNYAKQLDQTIQNAIANHRTLKQCTADFDKIKQQLDRREQEIRSYYFKKQMTDRPEFALGVGLGAAWIFGIGIPATAMVIVGVTILKAHMESSPLRLRITDIDSSRNLAELVNPVDYEFIQQVDALWGRGVNVSPEQARVNIKYVSDDVRDASLRGAQKAVDAIHRSMFGPILAVYAMQMFASSLFFIAAGMTLPIVWPLFAVIGTAVAVGLTYIAGASIVENVDLPNSRIYKVANAIVNALDFAIVRPVKFIFNAIKGLFYKPEKHAFDLPLDAPDFDLAPNIRAALDALYPGLANRFVELFRHRYEALSHRIDHAREVNDVQTGMQLQTERNRLITDHRNIIAAVANKDNVLNIAVKFLDRSYELERREFVSAAIKAKDNNIEIPQAADSEQLAKTGTPIAAAVRNTLLFNKDTIAPENMGFARDYVQERQNVQEIFELKSILSRLNKA